MSFESRIDNLIEEIRQYSEGGGSLFPIKKTPFYERYQT